MLLAVHILLQKENKYVKIKYIRIKEVFIW